MEEKKKTTRVEECDVEDTNEEFFSYRFQEKDEEIGWFSSTIREPFSNSFF